MILGNKHYVEGRLVDAGVVLQRALETAERFGPNDRRVAISLNALGLVNHERGRCQEAKSAYWRALSILDHAGSNPGLLAKNFSNLVVNYVECGDTKSAEQLLHSRLKQIEKLTIDPIQLGTLLSARAAVEQAKRRYGKAEPLFYRAFCIYRERCGVDHLTTALAANNLSVVYFRLGPPERALTYGELALRSLEKQLTPAHPLLANTMINLSVINLSLGRHQTASNLYSRAIDIAEKALPRGHPTTLRMMKLYTAALLRAHRTSEAEVIDRQALAMSDSAVRPIPGQTVNVHELGILGVK
jgi:tetratricopeptide (TPR) repeat protein